MSRKKNTEKQDEIQLRQNPVNVFICGHADCEQVPSMPFTDFQKHLIDVHHIGKDQMKGHKQATCHIDGSYWFSWDYKWTLECGLTFHQHTKMARSKDDLMYH